MKKSGHGEHSCVELVARGEKILTHAGCGWFIQNIMSSEVKYGDVIFCPHCGKDVGKEYRAEIDGKVRGKKNKSEVQVIANWSPETGC